MIKPCDADVVESLGFPKTAQRFRDTLNENLDLKEQLKEFARYVYNNAWDSASRERAAEILGIDPDDRYMV